MPRDAAAIAYCVKRSVLRSAAGGSVAARKKSSGRRPRSVTGDARAVGHRRDRAPPFKQVAARTTRRCCRSAKRLPPPLPQRAPRAADSRSRAVRRLPSRGMKPPTVRRSEEGGARGKRTAIVPPGPSRRAGRADDRASYAAVRRSAATRSRSARARAASNRASSSKQAARAVAAAGANVLRGGAYQAAHVAILVSRPRRRGAQDAARRRRPLSPRRRYRGARSARRRARRAICRHAADRRAQHAELSAVARGRRGAHAGAAQARTIGDRARVAAGRRIRVARRQRETSCSANAACDRSTSRRATCSTSRSCRCSKR